VRHIKIEYKSPKENANKEKIERGVKLLANFLNDEKIQLIINKII